MITTVELLKGIELFDQLTAEVWNALAQEGMTDTPFQHHAYQKAWWAEMGVGDLYAIVVRDEADSRLLGIAPLFVHDGVVQLNGSKEESDYLDILARPASAEAVWAAVLNCLCSDQFPAWQMLDLHCIPSASPTREIIPRLVDSRGFLLSTAIEEVCPVITLDGSFDDYLAQLDKKQRHEIRRKMRRATGAEATLERIDDKAALPAAVDEFLTLLQASLPEKEEWLTPARRALFHQVAHAALEMGILQLLFITVQGERCAALFNFDYNGRTWVYNSGLDTRKYGNLSLGVVLTAHAIERAMTAGHSAFDFLRGDEAYKYRFGARDTEIYRLQISRTST